MAKGAKARRGRDTKGRIRSGWYLSCNGTMGKARSKRRSTRRRRR